MLGVVRDGTGASSEMCISVAAVRRFFAETLLVAVERFSKDGDIRRFGPS